MGTENLFLRDHRSLVFIDNMQKVNIKVFLVKQPKFRTHGIFTATILTNLNKTTTTGRTIGTTYNPVRPTNMSMPSWGTGPLKTVEL